MQETPRLSPVIPDTTTAKTTSVFAFVLGIISVAVPILGLLTGPVAITLGVIALAKKTTSKGFAVTGVIAGAVGILSSIVIIAFAMTFVSGSKSIGADSGTRRSAVSAQVDEQKNFTSNEVAHVGPIDIKVTNVERNHQLAASEKPESMVLYDYQREYVPDIDQPVVIEEADAEYVIVEGMVTLNGKRSLGDYSTEVRKFYLNNVRPYEVATDGKVSTYSSQVGDGYSFRHAYRIRKDSDDLVLQLNVSIYKAVNFIFGTEGAAAENLTYTITLN